MQFFQQLICFHADMIAQPALCLNAGSSGQNHFLHRKAVCIAQCNACSEGMSDKAHMSDLQMVQKLLQKIHVIVYTPDTRRLLTLSKPRQIQIDNRKGVAEMVLQKLHHVLILSPSVQQYHGRLVIPCACNIYFYILNGNHVVPPPSSI